MKKLVFVLSLALLQFSIKAQPCSELFISEYVEGSGFNKAIEIYNPTTSVIDLTDYSLWLFTNGFTSKNFNSLDTLATTTLNPGEVYVIANDDNSLDPAIANVADKLDGVANFNGNDALVLYNRSTGDTADILGVVGEDPAGDAWDVDGGNGSTENNTLVRKSSVQEGTTNWTIAQNQWDVSNTNTFTNLGSHTMTPCVPITDTLVSFATGANTVEENEGPVNVIISLNAFSSSNTHTVDVALTSGDTSNIGGYMGETLNFNSATAQISIPLTFDTISGPVNFEFKLRNPSTNLTITPDSIFTLTVTPFVPVPAYKIATVRGTNSGGLPDSLGTVCQLSGTVIGPNFNSAGLQFNINDGTGGIAAFAPGGVGNFGYTVTPGDSVVLIGEVSHYNGWGQMEFLDTVYAVGTGRNISPVVVTELDETTESELITLEDVEILGVASSTGAGTSYDAQTSTGSTFTIRLDTDVITAAQDPIAQNNASQLISVTGIGGQFKFDPPFTSDYQIAARMASDIVVDQGSNISIVDNAVTKLYPNPAQNQIAIELELDQIKEVEIFDLSGKNLSNKIDWNGNNGNKIQLDISGLNNGSYIALIKTNEGNARAQFVIAR